MNHYLIGVIGRLELDLDRASKSVGACEARLRAAKTKHWDTSRELEGYKTQAVAEEGIEELGIRTRTVDLARRTLTRSKANKYLRSGNIHIESSYYRLSTLVGSGKMPKFAVSQDHPQNELRVLGWCLTILSYDTAQKSFGLANAIRFEERSIREEIDNRKEAS